MIGLAIALVALVVYLLLFARSAAAPEKTTSETSVLSPSATTVPSNAVDTNHITIQNYTFTPKDIHIKKNRTVIWINTDPSPHKVTVVVNGKEMASNAINYNGSYSFVFDKIGTFTYYDSDTPSERGTVTVTDN